MGKRYWRYVPWGGFIVGVAGLRLAQIDRQVLLDDEWHAIMKLATGGYGEIATSFGVVDHSIPLTLLFKWIAGQQWLSELTMLALPVASGIATCVILVVASRRLLSPVALVAFAGLLASSPLLILYSRQARPYALTLLLTLIAMWSAWRWAHDRRLVHAVAYVLAASLAAWMHVIVAPALFAGWLYLLAEAAIRDPRDWRAMAIAVAPGVVALCTAAMLLAPAFLGDLAGLRVKAGADQVTIDSAWRALMMWFGTGSVALAGAMSVLAVVGAGSCLKRAPRITLYVATTLLAQGIAVALSGALWISQPMILARYLLIFLPFILLAAAAGFAVFWDLIQRPNALPASGGGIAALSLVAISASMGPLPALHRYPNAFFTHQAHFADFDEAHNPMLQRLRSGPIPDFYRDLSRRARGDLTLIETPWRFESMFNRQPVFQEIHGQHVKIGLLGALCPPGAYAEHPRQFANRFRNLVDLAGGDERIRAAGDYLVVHRRLDLPNMTQPWQSYAGRGLPPVDECLGIFRRRFGDPVFEDSLVTVFRLRE